MGDHKLNTDGLLKPLIVSAGRSELEQTFKIHHLFIANAQQIILSFHRFIGKVRIGDSDLLLGLRF